MKKLLILLSLLIAFPCFGAVAHVTGGCSVHGTGTASSGAFTFSCTANATNDAVLFAVGCSASVTPSAVSITATGWTVTSLSGITGSTTAGFLASFVAIAPNTSSTTFTATFTGGGTCGGFTDFLVDEFSGNDTTGGTTTADAHNQGTGTGSCSSSVTPANNNDGVWGACFDTVTAVGSGYTQGQNDASGDWSEYKILSGGSGVAQTVNFTGSGSYVTVSATIKPAGGAVAKVRHRSNVY